MLQFNVTNASCCFFFFTKVKRTNAVIFILHSVSYLTEIVNLLSLNFHDVLILLLMFLKNVCSVDDKENSKGDKNKGI